MTITINGTTGIAGVDGSASTPAVQGTDTNTGIFFPAADTIAFGEGGAEAMRLDSSGRMLVGTTTSPSAGSVGQYSKVVSSGNTSGATGSGIVALTKGAAATSIVSGDDIGFLTFTDSAGNDFSYIRCQADANAGSNDYPGRLIFATTADGSASPTERARITSGGNFLVGTTNDTGDGGGNEIKGNVENGGFITVKKTSSSVSGDKFMFFARNGTGVGSISLNGTSNVAYNTSSDYRLKENIAPLTSALVTIAQLKPCTWSWKSDGSNGQGFIAHELQAIVPDCVTGNKDAVDADGKPQYQGVDTSFLVATLTAAIQELKAELDTTKARLAALEAK